MSNEFFLIKFYKLLIIIFFIFFFNYFNLFNSFIIILDWYINNLILSYLFYHKLLLYGLRIKTREKVAYAKIARV